MPSGLYWIGLNMTMGRVLDSLRVRPMSKGYTHACVFMKLEANLGFPSAGITHIVYGDRVSHMSGMCRVG